MRLKQLAVRSQQPSASTNRVLTATRGHNKSPTIIRVTWLCKLYLQVDTWELLPLATIRVRPGVSQRSRKSMLTLVVNVSWLLGFRPPFMPTYIIAIESDQMHTDASRRRSLPYSVHDVTKSYGNNHDISGCLGRSKPLYHQSKDGMSWFTFFKHE